MVLRDHDESKGKSASSLNTNTPISKVISREREPNTFTIHSSPPARSIHSLKKKVASTEYKSTDILPGESEANYVERQRLLNEKAREEHIAKMNHLFPHLGDEAIAPILMKPSSSNPRPTSNSKSCFYHEQPKDTPAPQSVSSSNSSLSGNSNSALKYVRMVKAGIPVAAVESRMRSEGIDPALLEIDSIQNDISTPAYMPVLPRERLFSDSKTTPQNTNTPMIGSASKSKEFLKHQIIDTKVINNYKKMVTAGVPLAAVKAKMSSEGLDPALLDGPVVEASNAPSSATSSTSNQQLEKYKKMVKVSHKQNMSPFCLDKGYTN